MSTRAQWAAAALGVVLVFIAAGGGVPRLIATGCDNRPLGITLAIEESDIRTTCDTIAPIWPITR